jgi:hypothetical protein
MERGGVGEAGVPLSKRMGGESEATSVELCPDRDLPGRLDVAQPVADQENVEPKGRRPT